MPTDPDRALLLGNDDCETLVGRVIRRCGAEAAVVETCLAMLGDDRAMANSDIRQAISTTYQAWGGKPDPENRAAHILSLVCRDRRYEPRIRAALDRYRVRPAGDFVRASSPGAACRGACRSNIGSVSSSRGPWATWPIRVRWTRSWPC